MDKFKKIAGIILFFIGLILFFYLFISGVSRQVFREKNEKPFIEEFEKVMKSNIIKVIIYCDQSHGNGYKVIITDKIKINELKEASTIDYGTKHYNGGYHQYYSIQIETIEGKKYMYGFDKSFSSTGDYCRRNIEYKGKLYSNPYNDCGQLSIYRNPEITESDLINYPIPSTKVAAYNLKLIGFIQKYADNLPFDNKNKFHFYNRFELREMNEMKNNGK